MVRSCGTLFFFVDLSLSLSYIIIFFNQTSYLISVWTVDLSCCTFDFPWKKEDLPKMCRSCYDQRQKLMLRGHPVLQSAFLSL